MTFKEKIDALKGKLQAKITGESTPEQIEEVNGLIAEVDSLETEHNEAVADNAKLKDTIVKMVSNGGNSNPPEDESGGSKPKTIEECIAEIQKKEGK